MNVKHHCRLLWKLTIKLVSIFWTVFVIAACFPAQSTITPVVQPTFTSTATSTQQPEPTFTPTLIARTPTTSPTNTPDPFSCIPILDQLPPTANASGTLISNNSRRSEIIHFFLDTGKRTITQQPSDLPLEKRIDRMATSPDGKWLAYDAYGTNANIMVVSNDGKKELSIHWKWPGDFSRSLIGWLDNQHLVFLRYAEQRAIPIPSTVILNPFTFEWDEMDLAEQDHSSLFMSSGPLLFASSNLMPDPSLSLLIYPMMDDQANRFVVLKDRISGEIIARLRDYKHFGNDPLWKNDGSDFLITIQTQGEVGETSIDNWFRVSRDGEILRLTRFADYFSYTRINFESRSPNGEQVVFWLDNDPKPGGGQWTIMDIQIPDRYLCIEVDTNEYPYAMPPIWSPNSRYAVIANSNKMGDKSIVIIVDTVERWAAKIAENTEPKGWILRP